jgi:hypothetical protein
MAIGTSLMRYGGRFAKAAAASAPKNRMLADILASGTMKSYARHAMVGSAIGGIQGAARKIGGDADASVAGGMLSGAFAGAAFKGFKQGWGYAFGGGASRAGGASRMARTVMPNRGSGTGRGRVGFQPFTGGSPASRGRIGTTPKQLGYTPSPMSPQSNASSYW